MWRSGDPNPEPLDCRSSALPIELGRQIFIGSFAGCHCSLLWKYVLFWVTVWYRVLSGAEVRLKRMLIMFSDKQHLVAYQQSVKPDDIKYCVLCMEVFNGFKKQLKRASGLFSFLPFSDTFCRFQPVETGKWQKNTFCRQKCQPWCSYYLLLCS